MPADQPTVYERLSARYESGDVPWDDPLPPPEVIDFLSAQRPGRALDLGCGYGRASIYMAGLGWEVDAIDFIPQAICEAARRAREARVEVRFHVGRVTDLDFLAGPYNFALDVGCGHSLDHSELKIYRNHLHRLLEPGGYFVFFGRLRNDESTADDAGPVGLDESELLEVFQNGFDLVWRTLGQTTVPDQPTWHSGWFRWRRRP